MTELDISTQLRQEQETNLLLQETVADLELALEDRNWQRLTTEANSEFTLRGRRQMVGLCRMVAIANPLVKRGLTLRISYIWGGGVEISARDQKVQEVVQDFWDDNQRALTSSQAQEELERALGTDGNVYLAAFTSPLTGRVQVRSLPSDEIIDIVSNPDDSDEPWFYVREYTKTSLGAGGNDPAATQTSSTTVKVAYPALKFTPATRIKTLNGAEVKWDAPMLHIAVNRLDGWHYGVPDVYASMPWARAYKDFLTDWALLTKSLAKFAWRTVGDTRSRANKAISQLQAAVAASAPDQAPTTANTAGQVVGSGPGITLEAIPKSGASIDANSGKPLAGMAAAGLGMPVTLLLADPGVTGARAVAETLDKPTALEMGMRRALWQGQLTQLLDYVIDQEIIAPKGRLQGTRKVDGWGRTVTELAGNTERTVDWDWPELDKVDPFQWVNALVAADGTGLVPPETMIRLMLNALGVEDADEILDKMKDENGDIVLPQQSAQAAAVKDFNAGGPPTPAVGQAAADALKAGKDPAAIAGSGKSAKEVATYLEVAYPEGMSEAAGRVYHWKHGWIPLDHADAGKATAKPQPLSLADAEDKVEAVFKTRASSGSSAYTPQQMIFYAARQFAGYNGTSYLDAIGALARKYGDDPEKIDELPAMVHRARA